MPLKYLMAGLLLCHTFDTLATSPDSIRYVEPAYILGEIVVKGLRPVAKITTDGVRITIANTYLSDTGTALDLLGKMPFVVKSGSDVEVLGKGKPLIYINNRQVRDQSEIDRLASSQIKCVEIVTNPGARYPSDANSVIRITTVAPAGEGFSLSDRTTVGYKHYMYLFEQANFNYRSGGFDAFGMLNYENYRERPGYVNVNDRYMKSGVITQQGAGKEFARYPVYQGKIGMNYTTEAHNFGIYYDFSYKPSRATGTSLTRRYLDRQFSEALYNSSDTRGHDRQHLLSAYYAGQTGKWNLSANFDALWQANERHNAEYETSSSGAPRDFITASDVLNRLLAGNVTATFPLWKGALRFGTEISNIYRTDAYHGNADYITANDTKINETTSALFAQAEQTFGQLSVTAGLRWEYTDSRYWQFGKLRDDESRRYHNLAPSASVMMPLGNVRASLSYMRRISRPAFGQLSSAVRYLDRYSYESGNPDLRPVYRDYLSASFSWKNIVLELEFCSTRNYFMWQTVPYPGVPDATLLMMVNMPRFGSYGACISYSSTFFGRWHPALMAGVNGQYFSFMHNGGLLRLNRPLGIFRFNNALRLPYDIWLNADLSARTSGNGDNLYLRPYWQCNLGLYKSFAGDRLSVKLQLDDVFDTLRQKVTSYDAISTVSVSRLYDTRDLSVTVRYNFNAARTRYRGHGAANTEKSRF